MHMGETEGSVDAFRFYALLCVHIWTITVQDDWNPFKNVIMHLMGESYMQIISIVPELTEYINTDTVRNSQPLRHIYDPIITVIWIAKFNNPLVQVSKLILFFSIH